MIGDLSKISTNQNCISQTKEALLLLLCTESWDLIGQTLLRHAGHSWGLSTVKEPVCRKQWFKLKPEIDIWAVVLYQSHFQTYLCTKILKDRLKNI